MVDDEVFRGVALGLAFEVVGADRRFRELLAGFASTDPAPAAVVYEVRGGTGGDEWREVTANGASLGIDTSDAAPPASLLRDLSARAVSAWPGPVIHGCALTREDVTVLISGASGAGKSTLSARLAQDGWSLLAEDLCAIDEQGRVQPFPRPFGLTDTALALVGAAPRPQAHPLHKALLPAGELGSSYWGEPAAPTTVLLLAADAAERVELRPSAGLQVVLATESLSLRSGQDLAAVELLVSRARWLQSGRSSAPTDWVTLRRPLRVRSTSNVHQIGRSTVLVLDEESFVWRPDGSVVHLDALGTEVLARLQKGDTAAAITAALQLSAGVVDHVRLQVNA